MDVVIEAARERQAGTRKVRRAAAVLTLAAVLIIAGARADASGTRSRYERTGGNGPRVVVVKNDCLGAEDSAAHLRLIDYSPTRVVLGCTRKGY